MPTRQRAGADEPGKRIAADPELRRQLDVCERFGISHSHYLGGPAVWTHEDREKVRAYDEWKASGYCRDCQTHADWWDPKKGGHRFAYIGDTFRCPGCEVKEQVREGIPTEAKGIHVFLRANPGLLPGGADDEED